MTRVPIYAAAAAIVACLAVVGPALLTGSTDLLVQQRLRNLLSGAASVSYDQVISRSDLGRIEVSGLGVGERGRRIKIGRLIIIRPGDAPSGFVSSAWARDASVMVDDVMVEAGQVQVSIPHLEMRGTDLSADSLKKLLDLAASTSLEDRLSGLSFLSLGVPDILVGHAGDDLSQSPHLTLHGVSAIDVNSGLVRSLSIERGEVVRPDAVNARAAMLGRIDVSALDLPLGLKIATGSRSDDSADLAPLYRSVSVRDVVFSGSNGGMVKVGEVFSSALNVRPLLISPSDIATLLKKIAATRSPADQKVYSDTVADALHSLRLDYVEVRGLEFSDRPGDPAVNLRRLALSGVEAFRLGGLVLDDMSLKFEGTDVSLSHLAASYDASSLSPLVIQQATGVSALKPPGDVADVGLPDWSLTMGDLKVSLPERRSGSAVATRPGRNIFEVPVLDYSASGSSTVWGQGAFVAASYDFSADPKFRDLAPYGIGRTVMSADLGLVLSIAEKTLTVLPSEIKATDIGGLKVAGTFGDVSPDIRVGQTPEAIAATAQRVTLKRFAVTFTNDGVVEKILPPIATSAKVSVPLLKAQLKAQTEISLTQALGATPATQKIIDAVRSFLDRPKTFSVTVVAPGDGVPVAKLSSAADPKALLSTVTIDVTANQ